MQHNTIYFLLFILFGLACADEEQPDTSSTSIPRCNRNETFTTCPTACPPTCDDRNPQVCNKMCLKDGCVCKEGYIRLTESGPCIKIEDCPNSCQTNCGCNEVLNKCAPQSPEPTCQNPLVQNDSSNSTCSERCECRKGFIRILPFGTCVQISECPCRENEVLGCKPCCWAETCEKRGQLCKKFCPLICERQCVCRKGWVLDRPDGNCIPLEKCPE